MPRLYPRTAPPVHIAAGDASILDTEVPQGLEARGTPIPTVPFVHVNISFPTPIIVSFTSPWQTHPMRVWISPATASATNAIGLCQLMSFDRYGRALQRCERFLAWVAIIAKVPVPLIWAVSAGLNQWRSCKYPGRLDCRINFPYAHRSPSTHTDQTKEIINQTPKVHGETSSTISTCLLCIHESTPSIPKLSN